MNRRSFNVSRCKATRWFRIALFAVFSVPPLAIAAESPRLVVLVSADQFRQDYLTRFRKNFAEDGLFRLVEERGASYSECRHRHAFTVTGPGHAVMMTGCDPSSNGIIMNNWFDRAANHSVYCVEDSQARIIGKTSKEGRSARNLLVETLGDRLKAATSGKGKVFGLAIKDRASILMAGQKANAAFWVEGGRWVTSSAYLQALPPYIQLLNDGRKMDQFAGQTWTLLLPPSEYVNAGPDNNDWEDPPNGFGSAFPHHLKSKEESSSDLLGQVYCSPFGNEYTLSAAREIIHNEHLGEDDVPDIFCIGLSSGDAVGHAFGPDSYEVEDMVYRMDQQLGYFCQFLDEEVGAGKWTLFFTSDHGVAPIPVLAEKQGKEVVFDPLPTGKLERELEAELRSQLHCDPMFNFEPLLQRVEDYQIYLNHRHRALAGDNLMIARRVARDWIAKQPHVTLAMSVEDLLFPQKEHYHLALQRSFQPERSGDVLWVFDAYCLPRTNRKGTSHGSPHDYDCHVPLLLMGAGIRHGNFQLPVSPACIASTVARLLGIDPPAGNVEVPLKEALAQEQALTK